MSTGVRFDLPPPPRGRRSQSQRTAETRGKILDAVVESIAEVGLARTTANEIARRAGVTWGAVQHHFGGKSAMLNVVLEDSFDHFAAALDAVELGGLSLEERVHRFVETAWAHFGSARYRCTFEILLHESAAPGPGALSWQGTMLDVWNRVWHRYFHAPHLSRRETVALQLYVTSVLSGLASASMLGEEAARLAAGPLTLLERALVAELRPR